MKKIISICICLTIIFCFSITAYSSDVVMPRWNNTISVFATIDFDGTAGTFTASVIGRNNVTDIYVMAWLYYKDSSGNWIQQTTWGAIDQSPTLGMSRRFTGVSGVEYKCEYTIYVYVGLECDEIHHTAYETCP